MRHFRVRCGFQLARTLADVIGKHSVQSDRGKQERHGAKPSDSSIGARRPAAYGSIRSTSPIPGVMPWLVT